MDLLHCHATICKDLKNRSSTKTLPFVDSAVKNTIPSTKTCIFMDDRSSNEGLRYRHRKTAHFFCDDGRFGDNLMILSNRHTKNPHFVCDDLKITCFCVILSVAKDL